MTKTKTAIIGSGISGLGAAYCLSKTDDITVFEKKSYTGGHARTVDVKDGQNVIPVDTGFIVFNKQNYPNFLKLLNYFDVPYAKSNMSFGVSIGRGAVEYCSKHILAQKRNLLRPAFWRMLADIIKFNKKSHAFIDGPASDISLGEYLDQINMGPWFRNYYIQAMGAAIWSSSTQSILDYPAKTFLQFFNNHGLLATDNHLQWYTILGGSRSYVEKLKDSINQNIKLNCGVSEVSRQDNKVIILDEHGVSHEFDRVVFASHADQTVAMADDLSARELEILSAFKYQRNKTVLHSDHSFMPKRKKAWASWVYLSEGLKGDARVSLTYWMNNLQPLNTSLPILNTMNPDLDPDESTVQDRCEFSHPLFNHDAVENQHKINDIQGLGNYWYCGAWQGYGFHEDGLKSALEMVRKMGGRIPFDDASDH